MIARVRLFAVARRIVLSGVSPIFRAALVHNGWLPSASPFFRRGPALLPDRVEPKKRRPTTTKGTSS
jgi:hypothetical protein